MKSKAIAFFFGVITALLGVREKALAQADEAPNADGFLACADGIFFSKNVEQNGKAMPGGADLLMTQMSIQYNAPALYSGVGLIYQMDKIGRTQADMTAGLKLELFFLEYYVDFSYGLTSQKFVDHLIKTRSGAQTQFGFGRRSSIQSGRMFFDFSLKYRTTTLTREDGSGLNTPVIQTELSPFLGLGAWIR